jgi:hypothetical protein
LFAGCLFGQTLEIGVRGGVPVTPAFETSSEFHLANGELGSSATRRYTVGPMVRLHLPRDFGVEFDALYHRLGWNDFRESAFLVNDNRVIAHSWEFPIVATYRLRGPFHVLAGPAFRITGVNSISATQTFPGQTTPIPATPLNDTSARRSGRGITIGTGFGLRIGFVRVLPEVRYTRWGADQLENPYLHSNVNQVEVLLGIGFGAPKL